MKHLIFLCALVMSVNSFALTPPLDGSKKVVKTVRISSDFFWDRLACPMSSIKEFNDNCNSLEIIRGKNIFGDTEVVKFNSSNVSNYEQLIKCGLTVAKLRTQLKSNRQGTFAYMSYVEFNLHANGDVSCIPRVTNGQKLSSAK